MFNTDPTPPLKLTDSSVLLSLEGNFSSLSIIKRLGIPKIEFFSYTTSPNDPSVLFIDGMYIVSFCLYKVLS